MKNADVIRLVSIWFMVTAHIGSDVRDAIVQRQEFFLILFDGLSRLSSPGLGFVSGYLAYISLSRNSYKEFLSKRARSLLGPFILWSMIYVGLLLAVSFLQGERIDFGMFLGNDLWGLTSWPGNFPLHYLLDLFKCAALMAGAFVLLSALGVSRHSITPALFWFSLVVFAGLTLSDLNAGHPGRNQESFLPRSDLQLFFSLGFLYAGTSLRIFETLSTRPLLLAALGAVFLSTSLVWYDVLQAEVYSIQYVSGVVLHFACRFAGAFLLFVLVWRLPTPDEKTGLFLRRLAFYVFVSHFIVLSAVNSLVDLDPLMAYSPSMFVLALQIAFVLAGLSIMALQAVAGRFEGLVRKTPWLASPLGQTDRR